MNGDPRLVQTMHHFGLEKILETHFSALSPITRGLVAPKGGAVLIGTTIDMNGTGSECSR